MIPMFKFFKGCQIQQSHLDQCAVSDKMTCTCPECQPGFHGHLCKTSK